jgi:hypothetical protein
MAVAFSAASRQHFLYYLSLRQLRPELESDQELENAVEFFLRVNVFS